MRKWIQQGWAIACLSAVETIRQPISLLLLGAAVLLMAVLPLVLSHTLGNTGRMVADSTLSLHFLFGLFLAGFAACHGLMEDTRRKTGALVLSKPVSRDVFFLAKFAGIAVSLVLFSLTATAASLLSTRTAAIAYQVDLWSAWALLACVPVSFALAALINYLTRRPFASDAFLLLSITVIAFCFVIGFVDRSGNWTSFGAFYDGRLIQANFLIGMAVVLLSALALGLATRFSVVPTMTLCAALFLAGLLSDYLFGRIAEISRWARILYTLLPNWNHFWISDALHLGEPIPWIYVVRTAGYSTLYLIGVLTLGMLSFRSKEITN